MLSEEAHRRAVCGTPAPVYWKGEVVGTVRKFYDFLLIFFLKAADRRKFDPQGYLQLKSVDDFDRRQKEIEAKLDQVLARPAQPDHNRER